MPLEIASFFDSLTPDEQKEMVLSEISQGRTIRAGIALAGVTYDIFKGWKRKDLTFAARLEDATALGCLKIEDELFTIHEHHDPAAARIASDNYKWLLAKRAPQVYSDRMQLDVNQSVDIGDAMRIGMERVHAARLNADKLNREQVLTIEVSPEPQPENLSGSQADSEFF